jgi:2-polyprenyl-3-methyl-5-hydroxy-6-metoxy-1,4-benzoquinol methylase
MQSNRKRSSTPHTSEDGIPIGNQTDKGALSNPIARKMVAGFDRALLTQLGLWQAGSLHEVGCGEGRLSRMIQTELKIKIRASDFSNQLIQENIRKNDVGISYVQRSIYDLDPLEDQADVVICCEVLEHLDSPDRGIERLGKLKARHYLFSVPNEPIWRLLNVIRGKYLGALGNTPGHLNHWSKSSFTRFLGKNGFMVERYLNPFPWLMVTGRFPS